MAAYIFLRDCQSIPLSFRYDMHRRSLSRPRICARSEQVSMVLVSPATRCSNLSCLNSISSSAQSSPRFFCGQTSLCQMFVVNLSNMPDLILVCLHVSLQSDSSSLLTSFAISNSPSSCLFSEANHSAMENSPAPVSLSRISGLSVLVPPVSVVLLWLVMSALSRALLWSLSPSLFPKTTLAFLMRGSCGGGWYSFMLKLSPVMSTICLFNASLCLHGSSKRCAFSLSALSLSVLSHKAFWVSSSCCSSDWSQATACAMGFLTASCDILFISSMFL